MRLGTKLFSLENHRKYIIGTCSSVADSITSEVLKQEAVLQNCGRRNGGMPKGSVLIFKCVWLKSFSFAWGFAKEELRLSEDMNESAAKQNE